MKLTILEIKRKIAHMLFGVLIVALLKSESIGLIHLFFLVIAGIIISFLTKKYNILAVPWLMKHLERKENLKKFPGKGAIFYLIGVFFTVAFFPLDIAMPAIIILAFADSASYIFGVRFGKTQHPFTRKKFIEGMVAGITAGSIGASIFIPWQEALAASFFAMVAEGIEIKIGLTDVDDNIVIPVVAAITISVVRFLF